ncbi:MAG: zincin-like metallopeptidase domain-containing protein [Parvimonas sp.]|uniref:zincin-like metallopeptidase domain-containing protein n=1 Tax=Parvimonas sp. TaxID=1944660 RepID=UPI002A759772|nr:zincin-like metallopeptidase domain-containing protein [Parvimonas sp.]MDY3050810.1 zincin-like metallopeptidase domain-containing protein [Parvimonas sp.]
MENSLADSLKNFAFLENKTFSEAEKYVLEKLKNSLLSDKKIYKKSWVDSINSNAFTNKEYSFLNSIYLSMISDERNYNSDKWLTFSQMKELNKSIKDEEKIKLKKGSKGAKVIFTSIYDREEKKNLTEDDFNKIPREILEEKIRNGDIYFFKKDATVFNLDCFDNIPDSFKLFNKKIDIDYNLINSLSEKMNLTVDFRNQNKAYYSIENDTIVLPSEKQFFDENLFKSTFFHELSHSTGHEKRLNRDIKNSFGSKEYALEEITAELSSAFLSKKFDFINEDTINSNAEYINSWAKTLLEEPQKILEAFKNADKSYKYISNIYNKNLVKEKDIFKYKTIYEYFNVKDKFELYNLLKSNDPSVKELKNFIEFSKKKVEKNLITIDAPKKFVNYIFDEFLPNKNEICILGVDTRLNIISRTKVNLNKNKKIDMKEVFKELNSKSLSNVLIAYNSIENANFMDLMATNLKEKFNNIDCRCKDLIKINNEYVINKMYSENEIKIENGFDKAYEKFLKNIKEKEQLKKENQEFFKDLTALKFYDEFMNFYLENESLGLNYFLNEDKILTNLRLPYQYLGYEKVGLIALDKDYNISSIKEYSSGDYNYSPVPINRIIKDIFNDENTSYIMYHNHPSGYLVPSQEDLKMSEHLLDALDVFDKKLIDSVIVSEKGFSKIKDVSLGINYKNSLEKNLKDLKISENIEIKNLDELKNFKDFERIEKLDLKNNSLEDIKGLIDFKNLKEINLENNPIKVLKNFEVIKSLEEKGIKFNLDFEQKNRLNFIKKERIKDIKTKKKDKFLER